MAVLIGSIHGAEEVTFLGSRHIPSRISKGLARFLDEHANGKRIGIETYSPSLERHVRKRIMDEMYPGMWREMELSGGIYWRSVVAKCQGADIVFLESPQVWDRYLDAHKEHWLAVMDVEEASHQEHMREVAAEHEECADDTFLHPYGLHLSDIREIAAKAPSAERIYRLIERQRATILNARAVHELERDQMLLEQIAANDLDIAMVGRWHADYWVAKDLGVFHAYHHEDGVNNVFTLHATPEQRLIADREMLERALRIRDGKRLGEGTPDYVGIWDVTAPSHGYFEVYIHCRDGASVSGRIEDCYGGARFEGSFESDTLTFTKTYERAHPDALVEPIFYTVKAKARDVFIGTFISEKEQLPRICVLKRGVAEDPVELGLLALRLDVAD